VYREEVAAVADSPAVQARRSPPDAAELEARAEAAACAAREKAEARRRHAHVVAACAQRGLQLDEHLLAHPAAAPVADFLARSPFERAAAPRARSSRLAARAGGASSDDAETAGNDAAAPPPSRAQVASALDALQHIVHDRAARLEALRSELHTLSNGAITLRAADAWPLASFAPLRADTLTLPALAAHVLNGTPLPLGLLPRLAGEHGVARAGREHRLRRLCASAEALRVALPDGMLAAALAAMAELAPERGAFANALFERAREDPSASVPHPHYNDVVWSINVPHDSSAQRFPHNMKCSRLCDLLCGAAPVDGELLMACDVVAWRGIHATTETLYAPWATWTARTHAFIATPSHKASVAEALRCLRRLRPVLPPPLLELIMSKIPCEVVVPRPHLPPAPRALARGAAGGKKRVRAGMCACGFQNPATACSMQLCGTCCARATVGPHCARHNQR
jgi:hypothetical protein